MSRSKARKLADMSSGTEGKVIGYDEVGEVVELETQRTEDDYIADEMVDMGWAN